MNNGVMRIIVVRAADINQETVETQINNFFAAVL